MGSPLPSAYFDQLLTTYLSGWYPQNRNLSHMDICDWIPVPTAESFRYKEFDTNDLRYIEAQLRAPGTPVARGKYDFTYPTDSTQNYAFGKEIYWQEYEEAEAEGKSRADVQARAVELAKTHVLMLKEKKLADLIFNQANWTHKSTPATKWNAGGTPRAELIDAIDNITQRMNVAPSALSVHFGLKAWRTVQFHSDFSDLHKMQQGVLDVTDIQNVLGVRDLTVGSASYTTSSRGATKADSFIWGDHVLIYLKDVEGGGQRDDPAAFKAFHVPKNAVVFPWSDNETRMDIYEYSEDVKYRITGQDFAEMIYTVNS